MTYERATLRLCPLIQSPRLPGVTDQPGRSASASMSVKMSEGCRFRPNRSSELFRE